MADVLLDPALVPMEAKVVAALPEDGDRKFEPRWDGFRCLAYKTGTAVELRAKSGTPLMRYFPEMVAALRQARADGSAFHFRPLRLRRLPKSESTHETN